MADPIIELISENDQNDNLATRLISNYSDSDSDDNDNDNTDGDSDGDQQPSFDIEIVIDHGTGTSSTSSMDIKTNSNENLFIQPREPVLCCTCGVKTAIYKCPGCNRQTCCVACSKQHKVTYDCTGIRPKSSFLPLSSMSDDTLSQDFKFLEDAKLITKESKRDLVSPSSSSSSSRNKESSRPLPQRINLLRKTALERRTHVLFLPAGLQRSKDNNSYVLARKKTIMWKIEWVFSFLQSAIKYSSSTLVNENTSLQSMLDDISSGKAIQDEILRNKIIGALDTIARKNTSTTTTTTTTTQPSEISNDNPQTDSQGSSTLPIESVDDKESSSTTSSKDSCKNNSNTFSHLLSILFKAEGLPANDPKYYHFTNLGQSLKEALSGLTFIEYPTFHLVLSPVVSNGMLVESKEELNRLVTAPNSSLLELELRSGRFPSRLRKKKFVSTVVSDE